MGASWSRPLLAMLVGLGLAVLVDLVGAIAANAGVVWGALSFAS